MLTQVLARPATASSFDDTRWEQLFSEARYARLFSRLWETLTHADITIDPPIAFAEAARGAQIQTRFMQQRALFEIAELGRVVAPLGHPVVLLKGAAYLIERSAAAPGRVLSDIDVLVPRDTLETFEQRLDEAGWTQKDALSDYDNFYYRNYTHEVPPRWNPGFHYELDVHHNIIQPTHRFAVDASRLLDEIRPVADTPFYTLSRRDQILHSATHLIMSDELRGGLRDVHDMCLLIGEASASEPDFVRSLVERAEELGLERALYYALDCARRHLGLDIPEADWQRLSRAAPVRPVDALMRKLIRNHLVTTAQDTASAASAERMLYIRSHWIRMPPLLLLRHLSRKAFTGRTERPDAPIPEGP